MLHENDPPVDRELIRLDPSELASAMDRLTADLTAHSNFIQTASRQNFRQLEALLRIRERYTLQGGLPHTRGWAASPDILAFLQDLILTQAPASIIEIGSGISTVIMADALRQVGRGSLASLEHIPEFAARTTERLQYEGLEDIATVCCGDLVLWTPPTPTELGDKWEWYGQTPQVAKQSVDLLFVDGPPAKTGAYARYPAVPQFFDSLKRTGLIVMDDTVREDETEVARTWAGEYGLNLSFDNQYEKGLAILWHDTLPGPNAEGRAK